MDVSREQLRERYESLETEELVDLFRSSVLTEIASFELCEELRRRGLSPEELGSLTPGEIYRQENVRRESTGLADGLLKIWLLMIVILVSYILVTSDFGSGLRAAGKPVFNSLVELIVSSGMVSTITAIMCFLVAVPVGTFRHFCRTIEKENVRIGVIGRTGDLERVGLVGVLFPHSIWFSLSFRIASWMLVSLTSVWVAAVLAAYGMRGIDVGLFIFMFALVLGARWMLSWIFALILLWMKIKRHTPERSAKAGARAREAMEKYGPK